MAAKTFSNIAGGNWNVGAHWTPAGVPGSTDTDMGGTGTITLASQAVAELFNIGGTVEFEDNTDAVDLLAPAGFTGVISGFELAIPSTCRARR